MMMINVGVRVERDDGLYGTGILFQEPSPTGSRPSEV